MKIELYAILLICVLICPKGFAQVPSDQKFSPDARVNELLTQSRRQLFRSGANTLDIDSAFQLMKQAELRSRQLHNPASIGNVMLMHALIANKIGHKDEGLQLAQQALQLFEKQRDQANMAEATIIIGQHYGNDGKDLEVKIGYYLKAISLFENAGAKTRMATTLVDLADFKQITNKFGESAGYLLKALQLFRSVGYRDLISVYSLLGVDYTSMGDPVKGLEYHYLSLKSAETLKDTTLQLSTVYNRLALAYYALKDYKSAAKNFQAAAVIARKYHDTASVIIITLNQSTCLSKYGQRAESIRHLKDIEPLAYLKVHEPERVSLSIRLMENYLVLQQFDNATIYYKRLATDQQSNDDAVHTEIVRAAITYYLGTKQYRLAYPYLQENQEISERNHVLRFISLNQLWWFKVDSALGNYTSAIQRYQVYKQLNDSVFSVAKTKQIALVEARFQGEKKDKDLLIKSKNIELLNKKALLARTQLQKEQTTRNFLVVGSLLMLTTLGVGYNRYRLKLRSNAQLQHKQEEINAKNAALQSLVTQKEWLLKEVHHRVKNNLQIVMSLLSSQSAFLEHEAAVNAIKDSQSRVHAISLLHQKLYSSSNVSTVNMQIYVSDLVNYLADSFDIRRRRINFDSNIEPVFLDLSQAVPLGLILNEAITNAIKYAFGNAPGQIAVSLKDLGDRNLLLTIRDNGRGLPEGYDFENATSLGLEMMRALSRQLNGCLQLCSGDGLCLSVAFEQEILASEQLKFAEGGLAVA